METTFKLAEETVEQDDTASPAKEEQVADEPGSPTPFERWLEFISSSSVAGEQVVAKDRVAIATAAAAIGEVRAAFTDGNEADEEEEARAETTLDEDLEGKQIKVLLGEDIADGPCESDARFKERENNATKFIRCETNFTKSLAEK